MRRFAMLALLAAPLAAGPAWAQQISPGQAAEVAARYSTPLQVSPAMPNPAGAFTLRMNGGFVGAAAPAATGLTADAFFGLTDQLGLNVRSSYSQTGPTLVQGRWNDVRLEGQWAVMQTPDKAAALSLVGAGLMPGGPGGPNLAAIAPGVGIRGVGTAGPLQANVDALYRVAPGELDFGIAGVLQLGDQLSGTLDLTGTIPVAGGQAAPTSLGITPGVVFRLTPGIRLGAGYVIPLQGTPPQGGQLLAHLQLGM
ncbi:MAG: hypothetical protein FJZ01_19535 [Candidatus Sericytochromatia bacterium]|nr:hypothetical protein [Candidatus Tanganyikabacteria bacterium]